MRKIIIVLVSAVIVSCASDPVVQIYKMPDNSSLYFIPASEWRGNDLSAEVDFNFKDNANIQTICNISITGKEAMPKGISSLSFTADSLEYILSDVKILFIDSKNHVLRITSFLQHDEFIAMMKSENIVLHIKMNDSLYECKPSGSFNSLKKEFHDNFYILDQILK